MYIFILIFQYPIPPNPEAYIGSYKDKYGIFNFTVTEHEGQLMSMISPTVPLYLSYKEDGVFQVVLPPLLPCIYYEVNAINNEWMYFDKIDSTGKSPGLLFPGLYGLDKFSRV